MSEDGRVYEKGTQFDSDTERAVLLIGWGLAKLVVKSEGPPPQRDASATAGDRHDANQLDAEAEEELSMGKDIRANDRAMASPPRGSAQPPKKKK
jgi:hypothetical protein